MKKLNINLMLILLLIQPVFAQNSRLLKNLQNSFDSLKDFSADFVQLNNGKVNIKGMFYFKKENKLRLELKNLIIVSDGKTNWNYNKREKKVIISNYDENDPSVLSLKRIIFDYPSKCQVTEGPDSSGNVLILKPNSNSGINAYLIKIWVNNKNNVEKVSVIQTSGNVLEVNFSNYKINTGIPDSEFSFTPPQGTKIIDLR
jgi:outer membrane lipoprotein carrier protein